MNNDDNELIERLQGLHLARRQIQEEEQEILQTLGGRQSRNPSAQHQLIERQWWSGFIKPRSRDYQVHVRTYNGHQTWRRPKNLRHLSPREQAQIRRAFVNRS